MKKNNGITLIALVITIVVLIILASVAITLSLGDNGVFRKASKAKEDTLVAQNEESMQIAEMTNSIDEITSSSRETVTVDKAEYEKLKADVAKKGTWKLLAQTSNTTATKFTVEDLRQFSSIVLTCDNTNQQIVASTIVPYELFKSQGSKRVYTNYNNGTPYISIAYYESDTSIYLYCGNSNSINARLYGIY